MQGRVWGWQGLGEGPLAFMGSWARYLLLSCVQPRRVIKPEETAGLAASLSLGHVWGQRSVQLAMSDSCDPVDESTRLLCPCNFPGKNAGVGCHFFLQGIFLTQGLNPCLLHCRWILLHCLLSHRGSPLDQGLNLRWDRQPKGNGASP